MLCFRSHPLFEDVPPTRERTSSTYRTRAVRFYRSTKMAVGDLAMVNARDITKFLQSGIATTKLLLSREVGRPYKYEVVSLSGFKPSSVE